MVSVRCCSTWWTQLLPTQTTFDVVRLFCDSHSMQLRPSASPSPPFSSQDHVTVTQPCPTPHLLTSTFHSLLSPSLLLFSLSRASPSTDSPPPHLVQYRTHLALDTVSDSHSTFLRSSVAGTEGGTASEDRHTPHTYTTHATDGHCGLIQDCSCPCSSVPLWQTGRRQSYQQQLQLWSHPQRLNEWVALVGGY